MTKALHIHRKGAGRAKRRPTLPDVTYPAGYFTELIYAHNWPPRFESRFNLGINTDASRATAQRNLAAGVGWGQFSAALGLKGSVHLVQQWREGGR
jgi:hypothetical protein